MDLNHLVLDNQIERNEIRIRHDNNKKRFKKLLKEPGFKIKPIWHLSKENIDLTNLRNDCHKDLKDNTDYNLYLIEKTELFNILVRCYKKIFTRNNIWRKHNNDKITTVLENWENGIKLIPPVLILNTDESHFLIQDGKHRFALANYFDEKEIPVIILKIKIIKRQFLQIVDTSKIKILE